MYMQNICYWFSHLVGLFSVTFYVAKFTWFFIHFAFRHDEGSFARDVRPLLWAIYKRSVLRSQSDRYKSKYKKVGVLPMRIVKSNVSSVGPSSERNQYMYINIWYIFPKQVHVLVAKIQVANFFCNSQHAQCYTLGTGHKLTAIS